VLLYEEERFTAGVEERPLLDAQLRSVCGERLFRITLVARDRRPRDRHRLVVRAAD